MRWSDIEGRWSDLEGEEGRDLGEMMGGEMMRGFMEDGGMPSAMPILDMDGYGGHVNPGYDDMMEHGGGGRFNDMGDNGGRWSDMEAMDHWFDDMEARWSEEEEEGEDRWSDNGRFSDAEGGGREEEWGEVEGMEREARRAGQEDAEGGGGGGGGGEAEKGELEEKVGKPERLVSIRTVLGL